MVLATGEALLVVAESSRCGSLESMTDGDLWRTARTLRLSFLDGASDPKSWLSKRRVWDCQDSRSVIITASMAWCVLPKLLARWVLRVSLQ